LRRVARNHLLCEQSNKFKLVDFSELNATGKAKSARVLLSKVASLTAPVLVVVDYKKHPNVKQAFNNFSNVTVALPNNFSYVDYLHAELILTSSEVFESLLSLV
jgi:ribosomal protein L4